LPSSSVGCAGITGDASGPTGYSGPLQRGRRLRSPCSRRTAPTAARPAQRSTLSRCVPAARDDPSTRTPRRRTHTPRDTRHFDEAEASPVSSVPIRHNRGRCHRQDRLRTVRRHGSASFRSFGNPSMLRDTTEGTRLGLILPFESLGQARPRVFRGSRPFVENPEHFPVVEIREANRSKIHDSLVRRTRD
jgi:hypothetical protein